MVPRPFAARIEPGNPGDPILRQVIATSTERETVPGFVVDPLEESAVETPGLLQKYAGRVLLVTTGACAVHCRYCFRRHFPYDAHREHKLDSAITAIEQDRTVREVILSGGDPLVLADTAMSDLFERLGRIDHVERLRLHTRLPVVIPSRITQALMDAIAAFPGAVSVVIHVNHPAELDDDTHRALNCLRATGAMLFNQAVLLKGVNNNPDVQVALAEKLFQQGVIPYYLHLPDRVAGTSHFFVDTDESLQLHQEITEHLPGYLVPRLVREIPGEKSKIVVTDAPRLIASERTGAL